MAVEEARRRRLIAIVGIGLVVILFAVELIALALGNAFLAGLMFVAFVLGWFALRSFMRRDRASR